LKRSELPDTEEQYCPWASAFNTYWSLS